jgi:hypothetical protein
VLNPSDLCSYVCALFRHAARRALSYSPSFCDAVGWPASLAGRQLDELLLAMGIHGGERLGEAGRHEESSTWVATRVAVGYIYIP